jgi:hypothetical protein
VNRIPKPQSPGKACGGVALSRRGLEDGSLVVVLEFIGQRRGSGGGEVVGDGLVFVQTNAARVSTDKTFVEDAAGELIEMFFFECAQHARANFRGQGNFLESDSLLLPFQFQLGSERCHAFILSVHLYVMRVFGVAQFFSRKFGHGSTRIYFLDCRQDGVRCLRWISHRGEHARSLDCTEMVRERERFCFARDDIF